MSSSPVPDSLAASLSRCLADVTESVGRSVVSLTARRWPSSAVVQGPDLAFTAAHSLGGASRLAVRTSPEGPELAAAVVGRDPALDVALLRIEGARLEVPRWRPAEGLRPGSLVLAVARPRAALRARLGLLAGVGPAFRTPWGGRVEAGLDVELSPRPGLAGAAVADAEGQVVGLVVSGLGRTRRMVLPTGTLTRVAEELLAHGRVRRGYLGVGTQRVRIPGPLQGAVGHDQGLLVVAVEPGSPADAAGLAFGDVLVELGGTPTSDVGDLLGTLADAKVGERLLARVLRAGALHERSVTVGVRP